MTPVPEIELNDGSRIPQVGFGVYKVAPEETAAAVRTALEIGYRHLDTATMYHNEAGVGQGVRDAGVQRGDVYITSKLDNGDHEPEAARRA
ncbi:MAG: 2,5-diketo-D-gluconate reductase, partial [Mycobacterium sp.]|nr:2,5-diketo-D-gluconate reductase [Mycobacterium sp.]